MLSLFLIFSFLFRSDTKINKQEQIIRFFFSLCHKILIAIRSFLNQWSHIILHKIRSSLTFGKHKKWVHVTEQDEQMFRNTGWRMYYLVFTLVTWVWLVHCQDGGRRFTKRLQSHQVKQNKKNFYTRVSNKCKYYINLSKCTYENEWF